jgi:hypothetical protein
MNVFNTKYILKWVWEYVESSSNHYITKVILFPLIHEPNFFIWSTTLERVARRLYRHSLHAFTENKWQLVCRAWPALLSILHLLFTNKNDDNDMTTHHHNYNYKYNYNNIAFYQENNDVQTSSSHRIGDNQAWPAWLSLFLIQPTKQANKISVPN